ncbi:MAG: hypothetical protein ABH804_00355 [archaeon]
MKRIKKENKEKIMEMIEKAGSDDYDTEWIDEKGKLSISKDKTKIKEGKRSRTAGVRFELQIRKDLENKERTVDKWNNNVDLEKGVLVQAKRKYNPFKKMLVVGTGFPDFISIKNIHNELYSVIGVEVKMNGILSRIEKEKCRWLLDKKVFSQIWIAKKGKKRGEIVYDDFQEKYGKKHNKT